MPYPFWDVGVGYGILMAVIAVVHVFVSHFAIGGGLYLVVAERSARRNGDAHRLEFLKKLSKFFILVTVVFGALTGVAIWFIIGLLNPIATEALIHNFVWAWAIEWTLFIIEILAAILYFYGWDRMSAKGHMTLGWIYFVAAWLSLVVINGIVCFMLTPGAWLETGGFWDGFFNPTYWPSLFLRTGVCVALAGLFALFVASREKTGTPKSRLIRYNASWGVAGILIVGASWFWYRNAIPQETFLVASERLTIAMTSLDLLQVLSYVLLAALVVLGFLVPRAYVMPVGVVMLALGLAWFGSFEWFREHARKPYVIYDYMYANGQRVDDAARLEEDGLLAHVRFRTGDDGADLFRYSCRTCHTMNGYNPIAPAFAGTDEAFVRGTIHGIHAMRGKMPPFLGSPEEAETLAAYIWKHVDQRPFVEVYPLEGVALGEKVYEVRCARCHVAGGYNDKADTLVGEDDEFYDELLTEELTEEMPVFSGSDTEKRALFEYLKTWTKGVE